MRRLYIFIYFVNLNISRREKIIENAFQNPDIDEADSYFKTMNIYVNELRNLQQIILQELK